MKLIQFDEMEKKRLKALKEFDILDTVPEQGFDEITKLASLICQAPISMISFLDENRQWFKSRIGLDACETNRDIAFCDHAIRQDNILIVHDAFADERFRNNPMATGYPYIRFYAGVPLITFDGFKLGALCVMDSKPRQLSDSQVFALQTLAKQVITQLELRRNLQKIEEQKFSLEESNKRLVDVNKELTTSEEEIRSNLERIKNLQNHLEASESRYRGLVENATDLIYELDQDGKFTFANSVMERTAGFPKEQLLKMNYWELVHPDHRKHAMEFYKRQRKERVENTYLEFMMFTRSGKKVWIGQNVRILFLENGYASKVSAISRDITILKQTELLLEASEKRFRLLSNNSPVGIFQLDAKGKLTYVNKHWCEITGLTEAEAFDGRWLSIIHDDDRSIINSEWKNGEFVHEIRLVNKSGRIIWVVARAIQMTNDRDEVIGYMGTINDITNLKETHRLLSEREELYRLLSANSKDLISLYKADEAATRIFVSPSSREILGYEPDELIGKSPFDLIIEEDVDRVKGIIRALTMNGTPAMIEYRIRRKDGVVIWMQSSSNPYFDRQGNMIGFQASARDITKRKMFEESLREEKEKAEEATLAKSQFLSMMSHEIRTPMNAIIGLTDLLLQGDPRDDQKESLGLLKFSGENLLTIINDILDFSKIEAGKIALESMDFDLHKLLLNTKKMMEIRAQEKNIDLFFRFDETLPQLVKGDSVRLAQVITNLVGNAIKFTNTGSVELSVSGNGFENGKHSVHFAVRDTGIGIEQSKIETIFERFTQADSDTTRKFGGTGLGLPITKSLLEMMGSNITVNSTAGQGSIFSFTLFLESGTLSVDNYETMRINSMDFKENNTRVLLVDDSPVNQFVASNFLTKWGITFDIANNGKEALDMIQLRRYNLVLMDIQMPVMDGYEAAQRIRSLDSQYYKEVPIIALTASAMLGVRDKVMEAGMNDFVSKPFVPADLQKKIRELVFVGK